MTNPSDPDDEQDSMKTKLESEIFREKLFLGGGLIIIIAIGIFLALGLSGCTITQTMSHTVGADSGDIQESAETSPTVTPNTSLTIPMKAL